MFNLYPSSLKYFLSFLQPPGKDPSETSQTSLEGDQTTPLPESPIDSEPLKLEKKLSDEDRDKPSSSDSGIEDGKSTPTSEEEGKGAESLEYECELPSSSLPVLKMAEPEQPREQEDRAEDKSETPSVPLVERSESVCEKHEQEVNILPHANGRMNKRCSDTGSQASESLDISLSSVGNRDSGSGSVRVSVRAFYIQKIVLGILVVLILQVVTFQENY